MKNEKQQRDIIIQHYTKWIDIAKDECHRLYAQTMLDSVYNENHKQVFHDLSTVEVFTQPRNKWRKYKSLDAYLNRES